MRALLFANNWGGLKVTEYLAQHKGLQQIVGLVVHPAFNGKFREEIIEAADVKPEQVIDANGLRDPGTVRYIKGLEPDIGISAFFGYILKPEVYNIPPKGIINLHPAFLPYNRGWHPNIYPILDGSPAGVSIHYIDGGIDTGPVLCRKQLSVLPTDTGGSLHKLLTFALVDLFREAWPKIRDGDLEAVPQDINKGSFHLRRDMREIERIDREEMVRAGDLIDILRGNTYPPYPSAYFELRGRRIYMRLTLLEEEDIKPGALPDWPSEEDPWDLSF